MRSIHIVAAVMALAAHSTSHAWNSRGHMVVAAVAWDHLTPKARTRATALLKLNPNYQKWIKDVAVRDRRQTAFVRAATWPDEIKQDRRYEKDSYTPPAAIAGRNIGYADMTMHRGWHFKDIPLTEDGAAGEEPFAFNAVSQIAAFSAAIGDGRFSDDIQSYDLAWLLHLVGDIHQPLHATSRFNTAFPSGDTGGNGVKICSQTATTCDLDHGSALHSLWDGAVGTSSSPKSAIAFRTRLPASSVESLIVTDPQKWAEESFELARNAVYVEPVGHQAGPYRLTSSYRTTAGSIAEKRIALAGERLAKLLNEKLGQ